MERPFDLLDYPIAFSKPRRLTDVSSWHLHIPFAFAMVAMLKPNKLVELGTHKGDSYCAFCQAVDELSLHTACYAVDTWKGDANADLYGPEILEELRAYHDSLYGGFSTLLQSLFDDALHYFPEGSLDLLHIDGCHNYESVRHDFDSWLPKMSKKGVILFHDTNVRKRGFGVWRLWEQLSGRYPAFEFKFGHGLGVLAVGSQITDEVRVFLEYGKEKEIVVSNFFYQLGVKIENDQNPQGMGKVMPDISIEEKKVSVIVVNYNGSTYIEPLFDSLLGMDLENVRMEIIMVDNLSTDNSVSLVKEKYPSIIVVKNDVNNFAGALNLGIDHAEGDYIAFLNNDMIVDRQWLKGLLDVMDKDQRSGAVQSKILFSDGTRINSVGVEELKDFYFKDIGFEEIDQGQYEDVKENDYFTGGSVLLRRACIESIGFIDEDFIMFSEDIDFSIRCRKAGWKILYAPKSIVYHKYHGSASSELAVFFCSRNRLLVLAKHFPLQLPEGVKTSDFLVKHEYENLYQSLIQAARKLIADYPAETSLTVLEKLKDVILEIYGPERTLDFFSQVEILVGLKKIKMGIYDHRLKLGDVNTLRGGEPARKASYYLSQIADPMYMAAVFDKPVLIIFNQLADVFRLLQESEQDRAERLEQIDKLTAMLQESEADRAERLEQINELTAMLQESEADRAERLEQINELTAMLQESEVDRAARLEVIHRLEEETSRKIESLEQRWLALESTFTVRLARRIHLINTPKFGEGGS